MMSMKHTILLCAAVGLASCVRQPSVMEDPVVAVGDRQLTRAELRALIPQHANAADSAVFAQETIRHWVSNEVKLRKARMNMTDDEMLEIDNLIDEYRTTLLVNKYQQKLIGQKFDPAVTDDAVAAYYADNADNFRLNENIFRGIFAILPAGVPHYDRFMEMVRARKDDSTAEMEKYLFQNARKYDLTLDKWMPIASVKKYFPGNIIANEAGVLRGRRDYVVKDEHYIYVLSVYDAHQTGEVSPLEYVKDKITAILINKNRMEFVRKIDRQLYDEALNENLIRYYDDEK